MLDLIVSNVLYFYSKPHLVFDVITEPLLLKYPASILSFAINHGLLIDSLYGSENDARRNISMLGFLNIVIAFLCYDFSWINLVYFCYMFAKIEFLWNITSKYENRNASTLLRFLLLIIDYYQGNILYRYSCLPILSFIYYYTSGINKY